MAMPTEVAKPWPSGPVVVSMPAAIWCSGWPGVFAAGLAELLQILQRHLLVAGQIIDRVEQHRAVTGGKHEPVAVGPGGIGRVELQEAAIEHGGDVGHAHRQAGMARIRLLDRVERQEANGIRQFVMRNVADCRCVLSHGSTLL